MSWTETTRAQYRRERLRFASDTTDAEWALLESLMPEPAGIGRPRTSDLRAVVNAILYILATGCQWRRLARTFRRARLCRVTSIVGATMGPGIASIAIWSAGRAK